MIKHVTEVEWPENSTLLYKINAQYVQDPDNYSPNPSVDNVLEIGTEPGGYFYIKTNRWAFDDIEELISILQDFKNKIDFANESK